MTEADREKVGWIRNGLVYAGAEDLCRIIRELEAERDKWRDLARELEKAVGRADRYPVALAVRWATAGRTIRRLRAECAEGRDDILAWIASAEKNAFRWLHAGETIRRLRRRWQWERRRAERAGSMLRSMSELAKKRLECWQEAEAERDALRARCERMEGLIVEACDDPRNWVSTAWHSKASAALKEDEG